MLKKLAAFALTVCLAFGTQSAMAQTTKSPYWQCVTFARSITNMDIYGDAWTWWEKASGKYQRGDAPQSGAVLVFQKHGKMSRGHVAVVSQVITDRLIQITHANWSPINGRRGQVEENVTVVDVSPNNDWSAVKVWYGPLNDLGSTVYPIYGFIYNSENATPQLPSQPQPYMPQPLIAQVLEKQDNSALPPAAMQTSTRASAPSLADALTADAPAKKPAKKAAKKK
ncbi:CHAP domain-containing protein [Asticcacaulis tiandongensis]|uniref:CHAP domain-containing protein n=1 Tax=Asticcacaulis tiandongensis TaxID=2565365 RepID=UPI00319DDD24